MHTINSCQLLYYYVYKNLHNIKVFFDFQISISFLLVISPKKEFLRLKKVMTLLENVFYDYFLCVLTQTILHFQFFVVHLNDWIFLKITKQKYKLIYDKGACRNHVDKIWGIFDPPPPL